MNFERGKEPSESLRIGRYNPERIKKIREIIETSKYFTENDVLSDVEEWIWDHHFSNRGPVEKVHIRENIYTLEEFFPGELSVRIHSDSNGKRIHKLEKGKIDLIDQCVFSMMAGPMAIRFNVYPYILYSNL